MFKDKTISTFTHACFFLPVFILLSEYHLQKILYNESGTKQYIKFKKLQTLISTKKLLTFQSINEHKKKNSGNISW